MIHSFKGYTPFIAFIVTVKYWLYSLCCTIYPCSLFIFVHSSSYLFFFFVSFNLQECFSLRYPHLFLLQTLSCRLWYVSWVGQLGIPRCNALLAVLGGACCPAPAPVECPLPGQVGSKAHVQSLFSAPGLEAELTGCLDLLF